MNTETHSDNQQLLEKTVGQLVAEQPSRSRVFERYGIDYCCGGKKPLSEACVEKGVEAAQVLAEIAETDARSPAPEVDWLHESLTSLCDHIEKTHHGYLREALPRLALLVDKVAKTHGDRDPRLVELARVFEDFQDELINHMAKEESILFPAIRSLELTGCTNFPASIKAPISVMIAEHDDAGDALARMSELTDRFTPAANACNTQRAMLQALAELEADMHQHVHKENNILFPRAIEKESEKS